MDGWMSLWSSKVGQSPTREAHFRMSLIFSFCIHLPPLELISDLRFEASNSEICKWVHLLFFISLFCLKSLFLTVSNSSHTFKWYRYCSSAGSPSSRSGVNRNIWWFLPTRAKFNPITDPALCLKTVTSQKEGRDLHRWNDGRRVIKRNPWVIKEVGVLGKCGISEDWKGQMMINSERSLHLRLCSNVCQWHHTQRDII